MTIHAWHWQGAALPAKRLSASHRGASICSQIAEAQSHSGNACAAKAGSVVSPSCRSATTRTKSGFLLQPSAASALAIVRRQHMRSALATPTAFMPHETSDETPDLLSLGTPAPELFKREHLRRLGRKATILARCEGTRSLPMAEGLPPTDLPRVENLIPQLLMAAVNFFDNLAAEAIPYGLVMDSSR